MRSKTGAVRYQKTRPERYLAQFGPDPGTGSVSPNPTGCGDLPKSPEFWAKTARPKMTFY